MSEKDTQLLNEAFDRWWFNEGSGMPPSPDEDHEEHAHRIARIAWHNGAYVNLHHTQLPSATPKTDIIPKPQPPPGRIIDASGQTIGYRRLPWDGPTNQPPRNP